jgi:hypothetical protein
MSDRLLIKYLETLQANRVETLKKLGFVQVVIVLHKTYTTRSKILEFCVVVCHFDYLDNADSLKLKRTTK